MNNPILQIVAVAPGLLLIWVLYKRDIYEPEPIRDLLLAGLSGLLAALLAGLVGLPFGLTALPLAEGPLTREVLVRVGVFSAKVGIIEEGAKLAMVMIFFYRRAQFNEPMDGVIYTAAVAIGFATIENVGYTLLGGLQTGLIRAITAVPLHAFCSGIMGYFVGVAHFRKPALGRIAAGWAIAAFIHAVYDFFAIAFHASVGMVLVFCVGIVIVSGTLLHFMVRALLRASPFRALSEKFKVVKNMGHDGWYKLQCLQCGHRFMGRLQGRVSCRNDACLNFHDLPAPNS
jgi:RsiW-degrading membrane proteinase PrsW (M82 family)